MNGLQLLNSFFFLTATPTPKIYTLSLHDALPIYHVSAKEARRNATRFVKEGGAEIVKIEGGEKRVALIREIMDNLRSEEHTSELQSHSDLVCRLLLEKKNTTNSPSSTPIHRCQTR